MLGVQRSGRGHLPDRSLLTHTTENITLPRGILGVAVGRGISVVTSQAWD